MKSFFTEFKKFIMRGNVLDMAVGVIVGSSFTAIVNALSNNILKPFINFLLALVFGTESLSEVYTFLKRVDMTQEVLDDTGAVIGTEIVPDLTQSIFIDWGSFINAILNFFLIALVLFCIVKFFNHLRDGKVKIRKKISKGAISKEDRKALKAQGIKLSDIDAVKAYFDAKEQKEAEAKAAAEAAAAEKARLDREANPTTEDLLKQILATLKEKN